MHWSETKRHMSILAAASALLVAAACGGDKSPTGPGGGGGPTATYDLVALGRAGLPADAQLEDCIVTRFYSGGLQLDGNGSWQLQLQFHDDNYGDAGYTDEGQFEQQGSTVWLNSELSGDTFQATLDGTEMKIMYDWCYNGVPDVQLVFDR